MGDGIDNVNADDLLKNGPQSGQQGGDQPPAVGKKKRPGRPTSRNRPQLIVEKPFGIDPLETEIEKIRLQLLQSGGVSMDISAERWNEQDQEYEIMGGSPLVINTKEGAFNLPSILRRAANKWGGGKFRFSFYVGDKPVFNMIKAIVAPLTPEEPQPIFQPLLPEETSDLELVPREPVNNEQPGINRPPPQQQVVRERFTSSITESKSAVAALVNINNDLMAHFATMIQTLSSMENRMTNIESSIKGQAQIHAVPAMPATSDSQRLAETMTIIKSLTGCIREIMPQQQPIQQPQIVQQPQDNLATTLAVLEKLGIKFNGPNSKTEMESFMKGLEFAKTGKYKKEEDDDDDRDSGPPPQSKLEKFADKLIETAGPRLGEALGSMIISAMSPGQPALPGQKPQPPAITADLKKNLIDAVNVMTPEQLAELIRKQFNEDQLRMAAQLDVNSAVDLFLQQFPEVAAHRSKLVDTFKVIKTALGNK